MSSFRHFAAAFCVALVVSGCGESIHDAALKGDVVTARNMLDAHPELLSARNKLGKTPLHQAITAGNDQIILFLLERGADINAKDNTGMTPLHVAACWSTSDRAILLLDHGANIDATDKFGDTPLHTAAMNGRARMCKTLIERGAKMRVKNRDGREPGDLARLYNNAKTLEVFVYFDAHPVAAAKH